MTSNKIQKLLELIPTLKKATELKQIEFIATPFQPLNVLMGGGFPRGRYTTIAGPSQVAKSTSVYQTIAYQQSIDPDFYAAIADVECALSPAWLQKLGVDLDRVFIFKYSKEEGEKLKTKKKKAKENGEKESEDELTLEEIADNPYALSLEWYLQKVRELVSKNLVDMILIDSVGALLPMQEKQKVMGEDTMLLLQKRLGEFFRRNVHDLSMSKTAIIFIGHVYTVPTTTGVSLEEVRGGHAFKYYPSIRLVQRRGSPNSEGTPKYKVQCPDGSTKEIFYGWPCRIKLEKTRMNDRESQEVVIPFIPGRGLDSEKTTILSAFTYGLLEQAGAWISSEFILNEDGTPGGKICGKDACVKYFLDNPTQKDKLFKALNDITTSEISTITDNIDITEIKEKSEVII